MATIDDILQTALANLGKNPNNADYIRLVRELAARQAELEKVQLQNQARINALQEELIAKGMAQEDAIKAKKELPEKQYQYWQKKLDDQMAWDDLKYERDKRDREEAEKKALAEKEAAEKKAQDLEAKKSEAINKSKRGALGGTVVGDVTNILGQGIKDYGNYQATKDDAYANLLQSISENTPGYNAASESLYGKNPVSAAATQMAAVKAGDAAKKRAKYDMVGNVAQGVANTILDATNLKRMYSMLAGGDVNGQMLMGMGSILKGLNGATR